MSLFIFFTYLFIMEHYNGFPSFREARKTMDILGIKSLPSIVSKVANNKQFTSAISFSMFAAKT